MHFKKSLAFILVLTVLLTLFSFASTASAFSPSVSISGTSSAQSGSTVKFSVIVSASEGFTSFSANINCDSGLTVTGVSSPSGFTSTSTNNTIAVARGTSTTRTEIIITCSLSGSVGASKTISLSNINLSDNASKDYSYKNVSTSITVAAAKSSNCNLASLSISNGNYSPVFNANTTVYSCGTVQYDVQSLNITAKAADSGASVRVSGNSLAVGANTISITVTAPNGAVKVYKINVNRAQDPNYVASSDASLSAITTNTGTLSPVFSAKVMQYVIYVPFETANITLAGTATDPNAKSVVGVTEAVLKDGKNTYKVVCTAEDGTEQSYTIYVVKMSKFDSIANLGVVAGKTSTTTTTKKAQTESNPKAISLSNMPVWLISVICVLIFALGFSIGFCVKKFGKKRVKNDEINYIDFVEKKK